LLAGNGPTATSAAAAASLQKLDFPVPQRQHLPALSSYARLQINGTHRLAGHLETTRGCRHLCRHCPLPAVYNGRLFAVPRATVLEDARRQVAAGAQHLSFGDADFLNAPGHGVRILQELHREFPQLTFDCTTKIEHLIRHAHLLPALAEAGVLFVVTAVETLNDNILAILDKGHQRADVFRAQQLLADAGLVMRPSLMPFTPWTQWQDLHDILQWVADTNLVDNVDAVQYSIRLLVPHGSLLQDHTAMLPHRGAYDDEALTYRWQHPEARIDALQRDLRQIAEDASGRGDAPETTFDAVWDLLRERVPRARHPPSRLAQARPATSRAARTAALPRQRPPRLTEPWFC
jgi:hypothetical protein